MNWIFFTFDTYCFPGSGLHVPLRVFDRSLKYYNKFTDFSNRIYVRMFGNLSCGRFANRLSLSKFYYRSYYYHLIINTIKTNLRTHKPIQPVVVLVVYQTRAASKINVKNELVGGDVGWRWRPSCIKKDDEVGSHLAWVTSKLDSQMKTTPQSA